MNDRLYSELHFDAGAGRISGTVIRYGSRTSRERGGFRDEVIPGAFGDVSARDVVLNVQHDRKRILARTGGGGLELSDGPESMTLTAELPGTREAEDTRELLTKRVLRGLSMEIEIKDFDLDYIGRTRRISKAMIDGVGVVDRPAFPDSKVILDMFDAPELTEYAFGQASGAFPVGVDLACDCTGGGCTHARFAPDAFNDLGPVLDAKPAEGKAACGVRRVSRDPGRRWILRGSPGFPV